MKRVRQVFLGIVAIVSGILLLQHAQRRTVGALMAQEHYYDVPSLALSLRCLSCTIPRRQMNYATRDSVGRVIGRGVRWRVTLPRKSSGP